MDTSISSAAVAGPSRPPNHAPLAHMPHAASNGQHAAATNGDRDQETKDVLAEEQVIVDDKGDELYYRTYRSEAEDMEGIARLVGQELSEPYNIYTFRYFLVDWPHLTFLVFPSIDSTTPVATIMCKQESHRGKTNRGYIGMLSVDKAWRRRGIATKLVQLAISEMGSRGAHEVVLETEYDNASSLSLYDSMGFMREKRLQRFYSNLKDAFRLILPLPTPVTTSETPIEASMARAALSDPPMDTQHHHEPLQPGRRPEQYDSMYT